MISSKKAKETVEVVDAELDVEAAEVVEVAEAAAAVHVEGLAEAVEDEVVADVVLDEAEVAEDHLLVVEIPKATGAMTCTMDLVVVALPLNLDQLNLLFPIWILACLTMTSKSFFLSSVASKMPLCIMTSLDEVLDQPMLILSVNRTLSKP